MTTAEEYRTASSTLFDQAMIELDAGDLGQASEKLWGAGAQALKSIAEQRGWRHGSHAHFYRIMARLEDETEDPDLMLQFSAANELHINFYENWLDEDQIRRRADIVREFVHRLSDLN